MFEAFECIFITWAVSPDQKNIIHWLTIIQNIWFILGNNERSFMSSTKEQSVRTITMWSNCCTIKLMPPSNSKFEIFFIIIVWILVSISIGFPPSYLMFELYRIVCDTMYTFTCIYVWRHSYYIQISSTDIVHVVHLYFSDSHSYMFWILDKWRNKWYELL